MKAAACPLCAEPGRFLEERVDDDGRVLGGMFACEPCGIDFGAPWWCPRCGRSDDEHATTVDHMADLFFGAWTGSGGGGNLTGPERQIVGCIVWNLGRDLAAQQLQQDAAGLAMLAESAELTTRLAGAAQGRLTQLAAELQPQAATP